MNLQPGPEHRRFREAVRGFLDAERDRFPTPGTDALGDEMRAWQARLIEAGYAARTIPKQYGGYGAPPDILKSRIIAEEFTRAGAPMGLSGQGIAMLVPTLLDIGTEAQKQRWIAPTLRGDIVWCQGYSEPGAGSDLAALRTSAVVDGDSFVINGQKIWTSTAHRAHMMFCLVRTEPDAPKHAGISYLIFPMSSPGIEVRPLRTMTGGAEFNEVFFTDLRVPLDCVVGGRGNGWAVANATLTHERGMLGDPSQAETRLHAVLQIMQRESAAGERLIDNPVMMDRLMALQAEAMAMRCNGMRLLTAAAQGEPAGMAGLIVKLQGCELNHQIAALAIDVLGELGILYGGGAHLRDQGAWQWKYMFDLGLIIGGGTAQIQKNIIAERGLDMPREPKVQKAVLF